MSCKIIYSGNVQGVGFRYRTARLARGYNVSGYVRNLADGSVELVAQGDDDEVNRFLAELDEEMGHYIHHADRTDGPNQSYVDFVIAH